MLNDFDSSFCVAFQSFAKRVICVTVACFTFVYSFCTRMHFLREVRELVEQIALPRSNRSFFPEAILAYKRTDYYGVQDDRGLKWHPIGK